MIAIIDKFNQLFFPNLSEIKLVIAQIPNRLKKEGFFYKSKNPEKKWEIVNRIFDKVKDKNCNLSETDFLIFPEVSIPEKYIEDLIELIKNSMKKNSVTIFGTEHINFSSFFGYLEKYVQFNQEAFDIIKNDFDQTPSNKPVNVEFIILKDNNNELNIFVQAKTHPFFGEESLDLNTDLYRSKYFYLFSSTMVPFNFMSLICFDYVYRDNYWSNIYSIVKKANELFFRKRQELDLLITIECNPKPEHKIFRDILTGFYGEHLFKTPGTRDTISIFVNSSGESELDGLPDDEQFFGHSFIAMNEMYKLNPLKLTEFSVDNFDGAPVSRIRFNDKTRLFYVMLNFLRDIDPRSSRVPVKIIGVYKYTDQWQKLSSEELVAGHEISIM